MPPAIPAVNSRAICRNGHGSRFAYVKLMLQLDAMAQRPPRNVTQAMLRGLARRCPACGKGGLFRSYLKTWDSCPDCSQDLHHHRTDDAPPYFTILIVGHLIVAGVLTLERALSPPTLVHLSIWLPLTLLTSLWVLPRAKGALVGLQWALYMHGFEPVHERRPSTDAG